MTEGPHANAPGTYYVHTFGCRVNQADSAGIAAELERGHLVRTRSHIDADVVVLNTCTVTHRSDTDVRKAVRRVQRENPGARVIVTGCYAQRDPEAVAGLGGVSAVVGNAHKSRLPVLADEVRGAPPSPPVVVHSEMDGVDPRALPGVDPVTTVLDRTRPFVKIQDGCDAHCTYCIIPAVRGRARGAAPSRVLDAIRSFVDQGYVEVVLAGVHLGTYAGAPGEPETLAGLVRRALAVEGLTRLRMSCIEPMAFPTELVDLAVEDPRLAPHFHLPLQSGCDRTLKRMVRPYRAEEVGRVVQALKARLPDACVGTDVIVGFPGETDDEFAASLDFVASAGFDSVHVFSYSDRDGTASTRLGPKVDPRIVKARSGALNEVGRRLWTRFLDRQVGAVRPAVTLDRDGGAPGWIEALTDNYAPVLIEDPELSSNTDIRVRIEGRRGKKLVGTAVSRAT